MRPPLECQKTILSKVLVGTARLPFLSPPADPSVDRACRQAAIAERAAAGCATWSARDHQRRRTSMKVQPMHALVRAQHEADAAQGAVVRALQRAERYMQQSSARSRHRNDDEVEMQSLHSVETSCGREHAPAGSDSSCWHILAHMRPPWKQRIPWYPPWPGRRPYSRRELLADALVHLGGIVLSKLGAIAMVMRLRAHQAPRLIAISVCLYSFALIAMFWCSTAYNVGLGIWGTRFHSRLRGIDHLGIVLLIAGTATPMLTAACTQHPTLSIGSVWIVGAISNAAKWSQGRCDTFALHLPCFLLMGWSCVLSWEALHAAFSAQARTLILIGGSFYTSGLAFWGAVDCEFHMLGWHTFVLLGCACFYAVVYQEVASVAHLDCLP